DSRGGGRGGGWQRGRAPARARGGDAAMTWLALTLAALGLFAQEAPEATPEEAVETPEPELIRVLVLHATREGRDAVSLDPTLAPLREWLSELPYDTFREAGFHEVEAPYGEDTG